jgi:hypothetical protein
MKITDASHLNDHDLITAVNRLAQDEREATVALIVHLAEFDARRLYEPAGYPSLFQYCRAVLRLSEDAVYNRIQSARAARRFPVIVDMLRTRALSPTTVRMLARRLTPENHHELLSAASGLGKEQVEELLAARFPEPEVKPSVRLLPMVPAAHLPAVGAAPDPFSVAFEVTAPVAHDAIPCLTPARSSAPSTSRSTLRPIAAERYEVRFTATAETREKLRLAQDLLGHAVPSGDLAQVVDRALTVLIDELVRRKFAATSHPREPRGRAKESDEIPASVRRAAYVKDGGRCSFVSKDGHRCGERRFIEFHHVIPRAAGGKATVENIRLRCRAHNGHEVDLFFGPGKRRGCGEMTSGRSTRPGTSIRAAIDPFVAAAVRSGP